MTDRQRVLYQKGIDASKKYNYINEAFNNMSLDELDDISSSKWYAFFEAGFYGREPEWVRALRYGDIPVSGYSTNWADGTRENGVSCVKIIRSDDDVKYKSIYDLTLGGQGIDKIIIEGWYFGDCGSDGEPLLIGAHKVSAA